MSNKSPVLRSLGSLLLLVSATLTSGCGGSHSSRETKVTNTQSADSMAGMDMPTQGMKHGNHVPKYGGVVLMNGDLHFEVVLKNSGSYTVYFSDAAREELPASTVSNVTVTVKRPKLEPEVVHLRIGETGENWVGSGAAITSPSTEIRVDYLFHGQTFNAQVPFSIPEKSVSS